MQTHDSIERRLRNRRTPTGKRVAARVRDIEWFASLHRHGPLSSSYLHEFTKRLCVSEKAARARLADLFHESCTHHGGAYLDRPWQQFDTIDARYQELIYDLTPVSVAALKERGDWHGPVNPGGPWKHRYMVASITASIELMCREHGFRYIPGYEILERAGADLQSTVPYTWNGAAKRATLTPDALFAIDYGGGFRAFVVEADRNTEPNRPKSHTRKSWLRNILQYRNFIGDRLYKEHYGLNCPLMLLVVTTSKRHMMNVLDVVEDVAGRNTYMCFSSAENFGSIFKPSDVLRPLFTDGWKRAGQPDFRLGITN